MVLKMSSSRFVALGLVACGLLGSGAVQAEAPAGDIRIKSNTLVAPAVSDPAAGTLVDLFRSLERSSDCSEFKSNFKSFYKQVRSAGVLSEEQRDRVKMVIALSCSQTFRSCNPSFCANTPVVSADAAPEREPFPVTIRAGEPELAKPAAGMLRGMETDKMAWLALPMSCEQLSQVLGQIVPYQQQP